MARNASADEVRTWAVSNGFPEVEGKRGRLKGEILTAFDKAHKSTPYKSGASRAGASVEVKTMRTLSSGKKVPVRKTVVVSEVRAAAVDAGVPVNPKGKVPDRILNAYVQGPEALAALATDATV